MSRVLVISDDPKTADRLADIYRSVRVDCHVIPAFDAAFDAIDADPPSLVFADRPPDVEVLHSLRAVLEKKAPATSFVVGLAEPRASEALEAMRAGAYDCVSRPYARLDVLAASKRAAASKRRALFAEKVMPPKKRPLWPWLIVVAAAFLVKPVLDLREGPPAAPVFLGSAHLSGLQWDGSELWVGDWFDSSVTVYSVRKAFFPKKRELDTQALYRMRDAQPVLICNTPSALVSVGADLKMRTHHRAAELPVLHTADCPGTAPTGLAWTGHALWSADRVTGLLYRHGPDLRVLGTEKSLLPEPVALAADGEALWVMGGTPVQIARVEFRDNAAVWSGPWAATDVLPEGVDPTGFAIGFDRFWFVSGGDPNMTSRERTAITGRETPWSTGIGTRHSDDE